MTENMAARGEGLAGLRDALNRHYWRDGKGCLCGWWAGDYNTWLEHMIPILAALEAAAPAGTAPTWDDAYAAGVKLRDTMRERVERLGLATCIKALPSIKDEAGGDCVSRAVVLALLEKQ